MNVALGLTIQAPERRFIERRLAELSADRSAMIVSDYATREDSKCCHSAFSGNDITNSSCSNPESLMFCRMWKPSHFRRFLFGMPQIVLSLHLQPKPGEVPSAADSRKGHPRRDARVPIKDAGQRCSGHAQTAAASFTVMLPG